MPNLMQFSLFLKKKCHFQQSTQLQNMSLDDAKIMGGIRDKHDKIDENGILPLLHYLQL